MKPHGSSRVGLLLGGHTPAGPSLKFKSPSSFGEHSVGMTVGREL